MTHAFIDKRSLALNKGVVKKIRKHPELMNVVCANLKNALASPALSRSCKDALQEWHTIITNHALSEILNLLVENTERGQRLRQSTPFWNILTQKERNNILHKYESVRA